MGRCQIYKQKIPCEAEFAFKVKEKGWPQQFRRV